MEHKKEREARKVCFRPPCHVSPWATPAPKVGNESTILFKNKRTILMYEPIRKFVK